jgi:hypothetical protein
MLLGSSVPLDILIVLTPWIILGVLSLLRE